MYSIFVKISWIPEKNMYCIIKLYSYRNFSIYNINTYVRYTVTIIAYIALYIIITCAHIHICAYIYINT